MRAFVTGGTGFIGANLVRLLLVEGYQVRVLVRPQSNLRNLVLRYLVWFDQGAEIG
jgi:dihydroflavonol-4-reductase